MTKTPPTRRRWLTFSLRSFLIGSTLASLAIWGVVSWLRPVKQDVRALPGGLVWREQMEDASDPNDPFGGPAPHGESVLRDQRGRLVFTGHNEQGARAGWWRHYYASGRLALSGECRHGAQDGVWISWDERGRRRLEVTYESLRTDLGFAIDVSTSRSGLCRGWWPSGRLRFEGRMKDDLRDGAWTFWDEDRRVAAQGEYRGGIRIGEWKLAAGQGEPRTT